MLMMNMIAKHTATPVPEVTMYQMRHRFLWIPSGRQAGDFSQLRIRHDMFMNP